MEDQEYDQKWEEVSYYVRGRKGWKTRDTINSGGSISWYNAKLGRFLLSVSAK
jgi:hypothetical protein